MISCTFENGKKAQLRHVVVDNLVIKDNKLLMVKRAKGIPASGKWGLVGGFMDLNETLKQAVEREVFEETGYRVKDVTLLTVIDNPNRHPKEGERQNIAFVFFCNAGKKEGESDWESIETKWFEFEDLPKEEEIAFDHFKMIKLYLDYKKNNTQLPLYR